jgi:hypothetical protein
VAICAPAPGEVKIELDLNKTHQVEAKAMAGGGCSITTRGNDPHITSRPIRGDYDPKRDCMLSFEYFCAKGLDFMQVYFGPPIRARQSASGPEVTSSEGWTTYSFNLKEKAPDAWRGGCSIFRLDFGSRPGRTIQIRNIRLRPPNERELKLARERDAKKRALERLDLGLKIMIMPDRDYRAGIERVEATKEKIMLTVSAPASIKELFLCEVPLYQQPVERKQFVWQQRVKPGPIEIERERKEGDAVHDRVFSSWILMRKTATGLEPVSAQRFVDVIPAKWKLTRDRPKSRKGTVGMHGGNKFQYDDYKALGIRNCTKNIVLNGLISDRPAPGSVTHEFNGRNYHVRKRALDRLDRAMLEMNELGIVVSAIILIAKNTAMTHPDCDPRGIWAMPDVTSREGWNYYAAGLDFLARRYTRPDRRYGRITHWIMHNEVDAGWIWTNAGEKPLHVYFDLYYRSMRTAECVARRYGVAGNVLISLTHHWTKAHNRLCYRPKDMLDLLARRGSLEGDFDWGLAYHPYPQNLRNPRTWEDTKALFSFDTTLITPRNLEVLEAYMRRAKMLYQGKALRTIVLSEQGSNSRDHSEKSYRDQAAGLVYTWLKLEKLSSIESYVHHRWMDPKPGGEGGLLLGFWTNLPDRNPRHSKKPAWDMYRMLETDEQPKAVEYAKKVIPPKYLEDIPYKGKIE